VSNSFGEEPFGSTPLYVACSDGSTRLVRVLLTAKADANLSTAHRDCPKAKVCTPLAMSCERGHAACVKLLLEANAHLESGITAGDNLTRISEDMPCAIGATPLMLAAANAEFEVLKTMIAAGASVNAANIQGFTALHWICAYGTANRIDGGPETEDLVRLLVGAAASLDAVDLRGRTPVDLARERRRAANVGILLEAAGVGQPDVSAVSETLTTALQNGVTLPEMKRVRIADVTSRPELNGTQGTLLHWKPTGDLWKKQEDGTRSRGEGRWAVHCEHDGVGRLLRPDNLEICLKASDEECCICMEPMPAILSYRSQDVEPTMCCGQVICGKCDREHTRRQEAAGEAGTKCAMCRQPAPENFAEGFAYLTARAEREDAHALCMLSNVYAHGCGDTSMKIESDPKRAMGCLLRAAEKDYNPAKVELGANMCGLVGRCACGHEPMPIPFDLEQGTQLLTECAALSSGKAYHYLARRYIVHGADDSDKNLHAFSHMLRAQELGDPDATLALNKSLHGSSMNTADARHNSDYALGEAIESNDLDQLKRVIEEHKDIASEDVLQEARRVRERWKKRARKQKKADVQGPGAVLVPDDSRDTVRDTSGGDGEQRSACDV